MPQVSTDLFQQIVGWELSSVTFVRDYVQLDFDGSGFNVMTTITVSCAGATATSGDDQFRNSICNQIGKAVSAVSMKDHEALLIRFADGSVISASLREEHYPGTEAVIFNGADKRWIVL